MFGFNAFSEAPFSAEQEQQTTTTIGNEGTLGAGVLGQLGIGETGVITQQAGTNGNASATLTTITTTAPTASASGTTGVTANVTASTITLTAPTVSATAGASISVDAGKASQTFVVTVSNDGGGNKYYIDGTKQASLSLHEEGTYRFDVSDSSVSGHPLNFSTTSDGTHNSGSAYTTGVTTVGTAGQAGAYVEIVVTTSTPDLYYYCGIHSGMGGSITFSEQFDQVPFFIILSPQTSSATGGAITQVQASTVSLTAAEASATAGAEATFADTIEVGLTAPSTSVGTGVSTTASTVSITAPVTSANLVAEASLTTVSLTAPSSSATGGATASVTAPTVTVTAPVSDEDVSDTPALPAITVNAPVVSATGGSLTTVASIATVTVVAPQLQTTAFSENLPEITVTSPVAQANVKAIVSLPEINVSNTQSTDTYITPSLETFYDSQGSFVLNPIGTTTPSLSTPVKILRFQMNAAYSIQIRVDKFTDFTSTTELDSQIIDTPDFVTGTPETRGSYALPAAIQLSPNTSYATDSDGNQWNYVYFWSVYWNERASDDKYFYRLYRHTYNPVTENITTTGLNSSSTHYEIGNSNPFGSLGDGGPGDSFKAGSPFVVQYIIQTTNQAERREIDLTTGTDSFVASSSGANSQNVALEAADSDAGHVEGLGALTFTYTTQTDNANARGGALVSVTDLPAISLSAPISQVNTSAGVSAPTITLTAPIITTETASTAEVISNTITVVSPSANATGGSLVSTTSNTVTTSAPVAVANLTTDVTVSTIGVTAPSATATGGALSSVVASTITISATANEAISTGATVIAPTISVQAPVVTEEITDFPENLPDITITAPSAVVNLTTEVSATTISTVAPSPSVTIIDPVTASTAGTATILASSVAVSNIISSIPASSSNTSTGTAVANATQSVSAQATGASTAIGFTNTNGTSSSSASVSGLAEKLVAATAQADGTASVTADENLIPAFETFIVDGSSSSSATSTADTKKLANLINLSITSGAVSISTGTHVQSATGSSEAVASSNSYGILQSFFNTDFLSSERTISVPADALRRVAIDAEEKRIISIQADLSRIVKVAA